MQSGFLIAVSAVFAGVCTAIAIRRYRKGAYLKALLCLAVCATFLAEDKFRSEWAQITIMPTDK